MSTPVPKIACALLALMNIAVSVQHLKDPEESLRGFGVQGPISPIAKHCCAIIGSSTFPTIAMLIYAITASAAVRKNLVMCYLTTIPPAILVQLWYPFNDPAPALPMEMPYPLLVFMIVLGVAAYLMDSDEGEKKKK